jgi:glyoxylase-like metal-dependent hydrolase (beta-lactamase superfamily II)/rhodanese-related sulfurtransferase
MFFSHIYSPGLAHSSYVIGGKKGCIVVDPSRDIEKYMNQAKSFGLPITGIIETHLHADFISGHMDLAEETGAVIYASKAANCAYTHQGIEDGETFTHDTFSITMMDTPGHTPEGAVFFVADHERADEPILAFTGDTVLVGDVGRPDLFPDIKQALAKKLFHSINKLKEWGNHIEVYPAHGMGSLCGRSLSAKLWTTLGIEKQWNYAFQIEKEKDFVKELLTSMPEAPDHFSRCSKINRQGPALIKDLPKPMPIGPDAFHRKIEEGHLVIDVRSFVEYSGAHVPGAYSIPLQGKFSTFAGWVIPFDQPLMLVAESDEELNEALLGLRAVGHDHVVGYLSGGMLKWINGGLRTNRIDTISVHELHDVLENPEYTVLDTRQFSEWEEGHIPGTIHAPTPDIRERYVEWDPDKPIVTFCNTSNRSILAASLLKQKGFKTVLNMVGGTTAWEAAGFSLIK